MESSNENLTAGDENESDYEYEYDEEEYETFLVDLDLSSLNDINSSRTGGLNNISKRPGKRKRTPSPERTNQEQSHHDNSSNAIIDNEIQAQEVDDQSIPNTSETSTETSFQILDLHTLNPLIAYQGQIYSCTWSDMIGTNMFFSKPNDKDDLIVTPIHSTDHYNLIGTSRIKLIGHKANLAPKNVSKKRSQQQHDGMTQSKDSRSNIDDMIPKGKSLGGLTRTNPQTNIDIKKQANFLEKLMDIKRAKGETDPVRTFVTRQSIVAAEKRRRKEEISQGKRRADSNQNNQKKKLTVPEEEIERLNRLVVRGDVDALARLQDIYSRVDEEEEEDDQDDDEDDHSNSDTNAL